MGLAYLNINDVLSELSEDEQVEWLIRAFANSPQILQQAAQQVAQQSVPVYGLSSERMAELDAIVGSAVENMRQNRRR